MSIVLNLIPRPCTVCESNAKLHEKDHRLEYTVSAFLEVCSFLACYTKLFISEYRMCRRASGNTSVHLFVSVYVSVSVSVSVSVYISQCVCQSVCQLLTFLVVSGHLGSCLSTQEDSNVMRNNK